MASAGGSTGPPPPPPEPTPEQLAALSRTNEIGNAWAVYGYSKESRPDIEKLRGPENYRTWKDIITVLLKAYLLYDVMVGNITIITGDNSDTRGKIMLLRARCIMLLTHTIDTTLHHFMIAHDTPSDIWQALENQFDRKNNFNVQAQFHDLINLRMEAGTNLRTHITTFETKWTQMAARTREAKSTDASKLAYRLNFILTSLEAKASFLLASLPSSMDNIVDNLRSKDKTT